MQKRKVRFNFIDLLLLLAMAAAIYVLLYVFVLSGKQNRNAAETASTASIRYVIEIQNIDKDLANAVKKGQPVQDAIKRKNLGTVVGVEDKPFEKIVYDYDHNREVLSPAEGRITLHVTVEAEVNETEDAYTADGVVIRVGEQYSVIFPGMYGVGFCTSLSKTSGT